MARGNLRAGVEMEYFESLQMRREPFSSSPDPGFFYPTVEYRECLQKLEIAIRLRRGLNLVLGEVGTGKTTLSRVLLQTLERDPGRFRVHLILDPGFRSDEEMVDYLLRLFGARPRQGATITEKKDRLQGALLKYGVQEDRIVVLIIDEGQKLSASGLELLRELLNFETNEHKLLQLVVFAQVELWDQIRGAPNLLDRINMTMRLRPLSLAETRAMILHRLVQAGLPPHHELFTDEAIRWIHKLTRGYPRRIVKLSHHAVLRALVLGDRRITAPMVRTAHRRLQASAGRRRMPLPVRRWMWGAACLALVAAGWTVYGTRDRWLPGGAPPGEIKAGGPSGSATAERPVSPGSKAVEEASRFKPARASSDTEKGGSPDASVPLFQSWSPEQWFGARIAAEGSLDRSAEIVVQRGDTLSDILQRHYGTLPGSRVMNALRRANPDLKDPDLLRPGQVLRLPDPDEAAGSFYSEPLGWFPELETARKWAKQLTGEAGPLFIVKENRSAPPRYAVFRGYGGHRPGRQGDQRTLVRVDRAAVLLVLERARASGGRDDE